MSTMPFVVGQWVCGESFYGRTSLLDEVLAGNRNSLWILGTRRIGKTSLLREIEDQVAASADNYFPLFWDFQGSQDAEDMHQDFLDSLLDAEDRLEKIGISSGEIEGKDLFQSLRALRHKLRSTNNRLLLLCDEAETLITLNEKDPNFLTKLRRFMQTKDDVRSVIASTLRLWALADQPGDTSSFLHGFAPPLYIGSLSDEEARQLIRQDNLPDGQRPSIDDDIVDKICHHCGNHPYLLQLVAKRYLELRDLEEALQQVAADPMVRHFFAVDFEMLSHPHRKIIRALAEAQSVRSHSIERRANLEKGETSGILNQLEEFGYIRRNKKREFELESYFFRRWFEERPVSHSEPDPTEPLTLPRREFLGPDAVDDLTLSFKADAGEKIGKFEILEKIGEGGFGTVFKGCDILLQRLVAIKTGSATDADLRQRFLREAQIAANLDHINIVRIHAFGFHGELPYLVQEYLPGGDLSHVIRQDPRPSIAQKIDLLLQIARGMEYAHSKGVIHRDLKPANIRVLEDLTVKVLDFGLAKRLSTEENLTQSGVNLGTPAYLSPEMINHDDLDPRSDIFSYGVLSYELLTHKRPFRGDTYAVLFMQILERDPTPINVLSSEISPELAQIVQRCLKKDPDQRFSDFGEVMTALTSLRSEREEDQASKPVSVDDTTRLLKETKPGSTKSSAAGRLARWLRHLRD